MNVEKKLKTNKKIPLAARCIIHTIMVNNRINEVIAAALKPFDVSRQQFNVLRILRGQKGKPSSLSTLNERMITKMSNTTRLVDKLITKGYVKRTVSKQNRRKVEITITKKGAETLAEMDEAIIMAEKELLHNFTNSELEQLNRLLDKF